MAGRAGRRGKDTEGIVMYLPRTFPDPPFEVEQMMIGKKPTINSRLEFHYSYILQSATSSKNVLSESFWTKQKQESIRILENDLKTRKPIRKLTEKEVEDCYEFERIQGNQSLLNKFNNSHMGPGWKETLKIYKETKKELIEVDLLKEQISLLRKPPFEIATRKYFLQKFGYLENETPTFLGTLASEIYEANSLLMSYAFYSKMFHELTAEELVVALAVFMESSDEDPPFDLCDIPYKSLLAIKDLVKYSEKLQTEETLRSDYVYWKLSSGWTEIACLWLQNETSKNICSEFQIYEGEFVKGILKLSSLLEEWKHLASLAEDNEMLDKLKDIQLIREIAVPDSLYLR
jgi:superfamily II RNA helicase